MATIVTRAGKGSNLTPTEADTNLTNINTELIAATTNVASQGTAISTNATNISANATAISTVAGNVATNTTAISANTTAITTKANKETYTYITQTADYTIPDFSAGEKSVDGTIKVYVIQGNSTNTLNAQVAWSKLSGVFNNTKENIVICQAIGGKVRYSIATATITDTTAPYLISAVISNSTPTQIVLTYSEALANIVPALSDFATTFGKTISSVSIVGTTVLLTMNSAYATGNTENITYTPGTNKIQDPSGNFAIALTSQVVTNNVTNLPTLVSAVISNAGAQNKLVLTYNKTLGSTTPATTDFVSGLSKTISSVLVAGSTATLTISTSYLSTDTEVISYTPGTNKLQDTAGNFALALTSQAVTNQIAANTSLDLTGVTAFLKTASNPTLLDFSGTTDKPFSIRARVKYVRGSAPQYIMFTGDNASAQQYGLFINNANDKIEFKVADTGVTPTIYVDSSIAVTQSVFTEIAVTYDGSGSQSGLNIYINGNVDASAVKAVFGSYVKMRAFTASTAVYIGCSPQNAYPLGNKINDVAIFNKALSSSEVTSIYGSTNLLAISGLAGNVKLYTKFNSNLSDDSGNGYDLSGITTPVYSTDI